jgi:hypothetical protein
VRPPSPARLSAATLAALAVAFGGGAFELGLTAEGLPGPGLLPLITSVLLLPLALRLLVAPDTLGPAQALRRTPLAALAVLAVYALALPRAGFVLPTLVLLGVWTRVFHGRSLGSSVGVSVALTAGAVLLFRVALGVLVPLWPSP